MVLALTLAHTGGVSEGDVPPFQKLDLFLKLESCNLLNTFGCKYRTGDEKDIC